MHFGGLAGNELAHFRQMRLGMARHQAALFRNRLVGVRRIPHQRPARFQFRRHLRAHVLHRLERADHAVELTALLGVVHRLVQHGLRGAQRIRRQHDASGIDDGAQRFAAVYGAGQRFGGGFVEHHLRHRARAVDGLELGHLRTAGVGQMQRSVGGGNDEAISAGAIEHEHRLAVQLAVAAGHAVRLAPPDLLAHRNPEDHLAGGDSRQPMFLLRVAAGGRQRQWRHHRRRHEGHRRHHAAKRFCDQRRLQQPKTDAAVLFVDQHRVRAQLRQLLPDVVGARCARLCHLAHALQRAAGFQIASDAVLQHQLFLRQCEIHRYALACSAFGSLGKPSARSPIMFF